MKRDYGLKKPDIFILFILVLLGPLWIQFSLFTSPDLLVPYFTLWICLSLYFFQKQEKWSSARITINIIVGFSGAALLRISFERSPFWAAHLLGF